MDLIEYRNSAREKERVADLMGLVPIQGESALDIGARDGFISKLLAERFLRVTSLDLDRPEIVHERILCVKGDVTALDFPDASFDLVFCAEVLEHIPPKKLAAACSELSRVSRRYVMIGVPFKQDIRVGRLILEQHPNWIHLLLEKRMAPGLQDVRTVPGSQAQDAYTWWKR